MKLVEGEGRRKSGPIMGIDVHKDLLAYCILTETQIIREDTLKNDAAGIRRLILQCHQSHVSSVAMESTAQYHFKLLYRLLDAQVHVLVANPQQTKSTQGKKTDKFDARRIAIAHRDGRLQPSVITSREIWSLRRANRRLFSQINDATKIKQRLNQLFHQMDFKFPQLLQSKYGLQLLDLVANQRMNEAEWSAFAPKKTPEGLYQALCQLQSRLDTVERIFLGNEVLQLRLLQVAMDRQRLAYYCVAKENPGFRNLMKLLLSVPGIGPDTAATILAEIADISYFPSPKHLAKWAGLAPRVYQSGHRKHVTGRIHKGGNKYLRRAVVLACQNIYAKGGPLNPIRKFMLAKKEAKSSYWLAICAGARKLLAIIWHMLKKGFIWGNVRLTPKVLETMKTAVSMKLKLFQSKLNRYSKIWEMLSGQSEEAFENVAIMSNSPQKLLKTLLSSV